MSFQNQSVSTLLELSLWIIAGKPSLYQHGFVKLPPRVKSKLLQILSKRGLLNDENIRSCLHKFTRELELTDCDISDSGLEEIAKACNLLQKLDLNSPKQTRDNVTNNGVISIARSCATLQVLYLRRCSNISDAAIAKVAISCRYLRFLNLGGCPMISDGSLNALAINCWVLESVNVSSTNISDVGVLTLCKGKCRVSLREFHMAKCRDITDKSVVTVARCCPKMQILIFHGCPKVTEASRSALEDMINRNVKNVKHITWTVY